MFLIMKKRPADAPVQNPITVTFSAYGSVCLEFFRKVTSETILQEKATVQLS